MSTPRTVKLQARALAAGAGISYTAARRRILAQHEPDQIESAPSTPAIGWREISQHACGYVTATGTITADGHLANPKAPASSNAPYALPAPTRDPRVLREHFLQHSAALLDHIPARIAAPLLGHMYVAPLRLNPFTPLIQGPSSSGKTTLARLAMQHAGSGDFIGTGGSVHGKSTASHLRNTLSQIADAVVLIDDLAVSDAGVGNRHLNLDEVLAAVHNGLHREALSREQLPSLSTAVRAAALITSEHAPASAAAHRRAALIPIGDEVRGRDLQDLSTPQSRNARATLLSSMISWAAADLPARRASISAPTNPFTGPRSGWAAITEFLVDAGALSTAERDELLVRLDDALAEAANAARESNDGR